MKECTNCKTKYPTTAEYFRIRSSKAGTFDSWCKECRKEYEKKYRNRNKKSKATYNREYYEKNKSEILERSKEYYEKNKEEKLQNQRQYYDKNRTDVNQRQKQYYEENKEELLEKSKNYYLNNINSIKKYKEENKLIIKKRMREWQKENADKINLYMQKREARKRGLPSTLTLKQWEETKQYFNYECAYCGITEHNHLKEFGQVLHQEHIIPIAKDGGYTKGNIIPACRICNISKSDKELFDWYPDYEKYNHSREQRILKYLDALD